MAANSIDSDQYVDGSIDTAHIADGQITVGKMAANSVDSAQYVDGSIDTAHYADNSITGAELADNIVIAGTLGSTGKITADAGIDIDNFNIDGTTIALSSGEMTIDVADNIKLDSGSGEIRFFDGGTYFGKIIENSGNLQLISGQQDKDILFVGNDNGSAVTALTLDMSDAGTATFNAGATFGAGIDVTGTATMDGLTVDAGTDKNILIGDLSGEATIYTLNDAQNNNTDLRINVENLNVYTDGTKGLTISSNNSISFYEDTGSTAKLFWDASAESLGIGTTSPDTLTHLLTSTTSAITPVLKLQGNFTANDSSEGTSIDFVGSSDATAVGSRIIGTRAAAGGNMDLRFHTARDSFAMIIDESQNVGIGTTSSISSSSSSSSTGFWFDTADYLAVARNSQRVAIFNRIGTDGEVVAIRKDGTTVGSIGAANGDLHIDGLANHSGIRFQAGSLLPRLNGSDTNGTIDLGYDDGSAIHRFKDLYLSNIANIGTYIRFGGASNYFIHSDNANYLRFGTNGSEQWRINNSGHFTPSQQHAKDIGGTNAEVRNIYAQGISFASNAHAGGMSSELLDDYEEGTWTPTSGVNLTIHTTCRYTKIGNHLTLTFDFTYATNSDGNSAAINSLPYSFHSYNSGFCGWQNTNLSGPVMWHVAGNSAAAYNGKTNAVITYADASGKRVIGTITGIVG